MNKMMTILGLAAMSASSVAAEDAKGFADFWAKGDAGLDLRYRLESVNQDGFDKNATASTLLTKLWYKTASVHGFSGYLEGTKTMVLGKETYNNTLNGNTTRPVVADPDLLELNQAYMQYKNDFMTLKAGRQGINLGNQRFVGTVGFRQNDQTYDAISTVIKPSDDFSGMYGYVWNVNRIFGNDHPLGDFDTNTHVLNMIYSGFSLGKVTGYAYLLDINDAAALALSSATYGIRFEGKKPVSESVKLGYEIEYASQSDYKDSPLDYSADYWNLGLTASMSGFTLGAKYELLGSGDGVSFKTPLATLHKFNGWADKFLVTPASGLQDINASIAYKLPGKTGLGGTLFKVVYHDFKSDVDDIDYGSEVDFLVSKKITSYLTASVKAAFYSADSYATDTDKIWFTLATKF